MPKQKNIHIANATNVWPHELRCARILAAQGHEIEFLPCIEGNCLKTPDLVMDSVVWELKSPESSNIKSIQRILRRASHQSQNVIIDCARAIKLSDDRIERELRTVLPHIKAIKRPLMVRKDGTVIDIKR